LKVSLGGSSANPKKGRDARAIQIADSPLSIQKKLLTELTAQNKNLSRDGFSAPLG
jgi:hypothetical protein